ncbi:MAG: hypothetical protein V4591_08675 [Bdellovibrionota bacterium]
MKKQFCLILLILLTQSKIYAASKDNTPLFEKNYIQIDPVFLNYKLIKADNSVYNENAMQFITSRPSVLFYFNANDFIFRPFISISPASSNTNAQGSFSAGILSAQTFEFGLYTMLNHTEDSVGSGSSENALANSQFLLGPYLGFYPYADRNSYFQIYARIAYEYVHNESTINGVSTNNTDQKGANFNLALHYSTKISDKIYYAPNVNFTYSMTYDFGGPNVTRNGFETQAIPVSFQMML